jgi:hypothetical protein
MKSILVVLGCVVCTSCTVYAPMQPTVPLLRQEGEAEISASVQVNGRVEATGAYSPLPGVMLTGGAIGSAKLGVRNFLATRQYELGAGLYHPLGQRWLLSGLGGYGQAYSNRGYVDLGLFGPGTFSEYKASYHKYFGQVGIANSQPNYGYGFTYRFTQVRFGSLVDQELGSLPLKQMLRHEVLFFTRHGLGTAAVSRWQLQIACGLSVSGTPKLKEDTGYSTHKAAYHANRNLLPAFLGSMGVVYLLPGKTRTIAP